jgi:hypothetical protein
LNREESHSSTASRLNLTRHVVLGMGLVVGLLMAFRGQASMDQYFGLVRGWMWYAEGWLPPFGLHMSADGYQPGSFVGVLTGLPLFAWESFHAVHLFVLLTHLLAYLLIDRTLRDVLATHERLLLAVFYWLNPWQLYFAGHLWNPNWLFLVGALHLWTASSQRDRGRFWMSLIHVLTVGLAFQIHSSFLILAFAWVFLWWRGYFRVQIWGAIAGASFVLFSLLPWFLVAVDHPDVLPMQGGFPGRGLVTVYPLVRGVIYWLRYPVLYFGRDLTSFDFTTSLGPAVDAVLTPFFTVITRILGPLTILFSLAANVWFLQRRRWAAFRRLPATASPREWLHGYVRWTLVATLLSFCLSPTTIMMWHALIVLHAAILPVVLWLGALWRTRWATRARVAVLIHAIVLVLIGLGMTFGTPMYRKGGRDGVGVVVSEPHPMLDRLGVSRHGTVRVDPDAGERSCLLDGAEGWTACTEGKDEKKRM